MKKKTAREKDLETLAALAAVSMIFYFFSRRTGFALLALAILALALASRRASSRIAAAWRGFSGILGGISTRLILGAVYFLFLTPVALLSRLFNGNPLRARAEASAPTYFKQKKHLFSAADLEKPW